MKRIFFSNTTMTSNITGIQVSQSMYIGKSKHIETSTLRKINIIKQSSQTCVRRLVNYVIVYIWLTVKKK